MSDKTTKKRDAQATRLAIIEAAKTVFAEKGFDQAGVREVAGLANVNIALINRYFGSKEGLFEQSIIPELHIDALITGDRADFGQRLADFLCAKGPEVEEEFIQTMAFIRSAGSKAVSKQLSNAAQARVIDQLARWIGGAEARERATMIVIHIAGFELLNGLRELPSMSPEGRAAIRDQFARSLQRLVDGAQHNQ